MHEALSEREKSKSQHFGTQRIANLHSCLFTTIDRKTGTTRDPYEKKRHVPDTHMIFESYSSVISVFP